MEEVYIERQRALIERSLQAEKARKKLAESIRRYQHELSARKAYFALQRKKRHSIVHDCKVVRKPKKASNAIEKGVGVTMRTRRFDNSHITVCYKHRLV